MKKKKRSKWRKVWLFAALCCLCGCQAPKPLSEWAPETVGPFTAEESGVDLSEKQDPEGTLVIHVCGEVLVPGVYTLPAGSRLQDAVLAAGGMTEQAAPDALNLARPLQDGEQVWVPDEEAVASLGATESRTENGKVNLNTADQSRLETLPGIGPAKAEAILAYRRDYGAFAAPEDLMKVSGIGKATFEKLKDYITV